MKFIGIILLLLTSIFLVACSANQASNNASNSEIKELGKKYGGVYIFNRKFYDEIEKRERERSDYMDNFFKNNKRNFKRDDLAIMDKKLPQILSNGKRYYLKWLDYENEAGKKVKIPDEYVNKIKEFIGDENFSKSPKPLLRKFYIDNGQIMPITISLTYSYQSKKYGLFGDEGAGIKFSKSETNYVLGGNKFYFDSSKNTFVKEK